MGILAHFRPSVSLGIFGDRLDYLKDASESLGTGVEQTNWLGGRSSI